MNTRIKYPRTPHLPWSPGVSSDDIYCSSLSNFQGREVVVTEKMDGENTTLYRDYCHARSLDSRHHPSRDWVKAFHGRICHNIPNNWRVCGENLFAQHSIQYTSLESYFYGFSIWNNDNACLSWDETQTWMDALGIASVPVLYRGVWDAGQVESLTVDISQVEGYVVRLAESFAFDGFSQSIAKWVRTDHVQSDKHWMHSQIIPNRLRAHKS